MGRCPPAGRPGQRSPPRFLPSREPRGGRSRRPPGAWLAAPAMLGPSFHPLTALCSSCLAVFPLQLAGPAGGDAEDPSSPPISLIQRLLLLLRGEGGEVREGGVEGGIKTNISNWRKGQIWQRSQGLPSIAFCRKGLVRPELASRQPGLCPPPRGAVTVLRAITSSVNAPMCFCLSFFFFLLYIE